MYDYAALRSSAIDKVNRIFSTFELTEDFDDLGRTIIELCLNFQIIAVAALLEDADSIKFNRNLCRICSNWVKYLKYCVGRNLIPKKPSYIVPIFSYILSGNKEFAIEMVGLAKKLPKSDFEYEDEFQFKQLVSFLSEFAMFENLDCKSKILECKNSLDKIGNDRATFQSQLAGAIIEKNEDDFIAIFRNYSEYHEFENENQSKNLATPFTIYSPNRYIWFEGLSWLKLAEISQFFVGQQFLYCPFLARKSIDYTYDNDWILEF